MEWIWIGSRVKCSDDRVGVVTDVNGFFISVNFGDVESEEVHINKLTKLDKSGPLPSLYN
jgi:hypothetical protein